MAKWQVVTISCGVCPDSGHPPYQDGGHSQCCPIWLSPTIGKWCGDTVPCTYGGYGGHSLYADGGRSPYHRVFIYMVVTHHIQMVSAHHIVWCSPIRSSPTICKWCGDTVPYTNSGYGGHSPYRDGGRSPYRTVSANTVVTHHV